MLRANMSCAAKDSDFGATGTGSSNVHDRIDIMKKLMQSHSGLGLNGVRV